MKVKDKVMIYQDPCTEKNKEGEATLLKCLDENKGVWNGRRMQYWKVRFVNDGMVTTRSILAPAGKE